MWVASSKQLKTLRENMEVAWKKEFCLQAAVGLKIAMATLPLVSGLPGLPCRFWTC